ncbi:MAG: hypothetical protein M3252_08620 [Actinomycetota bacterium]|nr:hypothetical protein [Actinomycetota bacterium]
MAAPTARVRPVAIPDDLDALDREPLRGESICRDMSAGAARWSPTTLVTAPTAGR